MIIPTSFPNRLSCYPVCLFLVTGTVLSGADRFVPDFKIKPDDYTVLMAADGQNPGGLRAWINDHRRMQVKNWPLGGQTTWEVEVVEAGDYAVSVLFNHRVRSSLKVAVMAGAARCEGVSEHVAHHEWRRFSLPGALRLAPGRQRLALSIAPVSGESPEKLELLSIELVRPEVKDRLHRAALAMRAQADTQWFRDARYGLMCHWTSQTVPRHGPPKAYAEAVRDFDIKTFAEQVEQTGARYVCICTSHAHLYFPAPLKSLDRILPGRTAQRDLVADLANALGQRNIRLMLYYHLGSDADRAWQEASGFWTTDTSEFWNNWAAVIGEAGDRYGEKLAGWWFDDGTANYYYRSAPWERLATAAKAGNLYLHLVEKGSDGKYHLPPSHSPEAFSGPDTNYDLASLRWGCETLLWIDRRLGANDPLAARWRDVLDRLVEYAVDQTGYMGGPGKAAPRGHRHWSHLIMIYPYYQVNWDQPEQRELIERSWRYWAWDRVPNAWSQAVMSSMASSMGKGDDALRHLDLALASRNLAPNTMHTEGGNPCSETHGGLCQMLHDTLLQSWGDKIRVFPAVPAAWADATFHNLRAEGAFLVSAARQGGRTQWVRIQSLAGEPCRIRPSFAGQVKVHCPGKTIPTRKIADDVYELSLARGDEVLLYDAAKVPEPMVRPTATDSPARNPYGIRSAK